MSEDNMDVDDYTFLTAETNLGPNGTMNVSHVHSEGPGQTFQTAEDTGYGDNADTAQGGFDGGAGLDDGGFDVYDGGGGGVDDDDFDVGVGDGGLDGADLTGQLDDDPNVPDEETSGLPHALVGRVCVS